MPDSMRDTWWRLSLGELGSALRARRIDPVALLDLCLERMAKLDPALNTMVFIDELGARAAASASAERFRAGQPRSRLDGIPVTIKDNLLVRGMPATWGSRTFETYVPDRDELPVRRLREAGAVLVGKTNVPELTLEGYTSNLLFGPTRNPWNPALTPGGSSGGAASGVAAGLVPVAIGTDGGGSIRRPASHTGLVGLKSSIGRYARADGFPELLSDLEVVGALTRSIADTRIVDAILRGSHRDDPRSILPASPPAPTGRLRILYVPRFGDAPLDPDIEGCCDAVAQRLAGQAHAVTTGPVPFDTNETDEIWRVLGRSGVAMLAQRNAELTGLAGPTVQGLAREGAAISAADYVEILGRITAFRRQIARLFDDTDIIFMPSAAALPWPAAEAYPPLIDGHPVGPRGHAIYTNWVNIAGHPAINLPLGLSRQGLPIGGQFVAAFAADDALLDFADGLAPPVSWPGYSQTVS